MKRQIAAAALATALLAVAPRVEASVIVSAEAPGSFQPSFGNATILTFDNLGLGALSNYNFAGGHLSGNGGVEQSTTGTYASPAGDASRYFTVSLNAPAGSAFLTLTAPQNRFGLFWGSMDDYNSIAFLKNGGTVAQYTGTQIASLAGLSANGNQNAAASNRYIDFDFGAFGFDAVTLSTSSYAFEVDNIAFGRGTIIPEPATLASFATGLAFLGLIALKRKRARVK